MSLSDSELTIIYPSYTTIIVLGKVLLVWLMVSFKNTIFQCNDVAVLYRLPVINVGSTDQILGSDTNVVRILHDTAM
jgi:hypothetical protein